MRKHISIRIAQLSFCLVAALSSAPAICAPAPAQSRSSAASLALRQLDFILAPQERTNSMIATATLHRPSKRAPMAIQTIPVSISVSPSSFTGGNNATCTITVNQVPPGGGAVLVSCDYPGVLHSPTSSWPYTLVYPSGSSTTRSFTLTSSSVSSSTVVRVYACQTDLDISNPANWQVITTCTVTP